MAHSPRLPCLLLLCLALACGGSSSSPPGPVDTCNSPTEALAEPACELRPGLALERTLALPSGDGDEDWYRVQVPASAGPRTLVQVGAAYAASVASPPVLALELRADDGQRLLARAAAPPQPTELVTTADAPSSVLLVRVSAAPGTQPGANAVHPYRLLLQLPEDPDVQEPGPSAPLPLAPQGSELVGQATGYLAAQGDVDRYELLLPAGKLVHVQLEVPDTGAVPRWEPVLALDPARADGDVSLPASAGPGVRVFVRRVEEGGVWHLWVSGAASLAGDPAPGDLRQPYVLRVRVLDEEDVQDRTAPNDTLARATLRSLEGTTPGTPGAAVAFVGRLASQGDADWYAVRLPAAGAHTLLHYRLVPLSTGGRFAPLPGSHDRQLHVTTEVTVGATPEARRDACLGSVMVCPRSSDDARMRAYCTGTDLPGPQCLHSARDEAPDAFAGLRNFEGVLPVPPHGSALTYHLLVQDAQRNGADDRDYRLEVTWRAEAADEAQEPVQRRLAGTEAFPAPPDAPEFATGGVLSYGHGYRLEGVAGVRAPGDYDAVATDVDRFSFELPSVTAPEDRTWLLQAQVQHLPDGGVPAQLELGLTFCDGDALSGGVCTPVTLGSAGAPLVLAPSTQPQKPWYGSGEVAPLWLAETSASATTLTLAPAACGCLERRFVRGGRLHVDVWAAGRTDHAPVQYTLRTAHGPYPRGTCPAPVAEPQAPLPDGGVPVRYTGGCEFTRQP